MELGILDLFVLFATCELILFANQSHQIKLE